MFLRTRRKLGLAKNCTEKVLPETVGEKNLRNLLTWPKTSQNGKFSNTALLQLSERIIDFVVT